MTRPVSYNHMENIFEKIMKNGAFFVFTACVVVFEIIAFEILDLLQALRCNTQTFLNFLRKNREKIASIDREFYAEQIC